MPTTSHRFPTPEPITLHVTNARGAVEIVATDTGLTTADISCRDEARPTRVELSPDGRTLTIEAPRRHLTGSPRVHMTVRVPTGSTVVSRTASASLEVRGSLARLDGVSASGSVTIEDVTGDATVKTASGSVRLGSIGGRLRAQSASGSLRAAAVEGTCEAHSASGSIDIGRAGADIDAKTASGGIALGDAHVGLMKATSTSGSVSVGVRRGTLVQLDLSSVSGRVRSELTPEEPGASGGEGAILSVVARTVSGGIRVHRSHDAPVHA